MDYFAGLIEILAKYIVGRKNKWGWLIHIFSGLLWTVIAFRIKVYGLLIITVPAFFINLYNFWKWHKEK